MRLFQKEHVFHNDWGTITSAFWVKYPNELQPHVLRVDTLDLQIDEEKQQFTCRRLLSLKYQCPRWVQKFFGASPVGFAVEEATCSLRDRKLTLKSCNYTFASFFRVEEACEYTPHPENPQHTLYKQTATYKVSGLGLPVNRAVENAAVAQAAEKSLLGVSVVERLGTFLAEQQWRKSCSSCLVSLEEAAASASKHAQEKYRQLRQRVEKKLGVTADAGHIPNENLDVPATASRVENSTATRRVNAGPSHSSGCTKAQHHDEPSGFHEAWKFDEHLSEMPAWAMRRSFAPVHFQNNEIFAKDTIGGGPARETDGQSGPEEGNAQADCPCRMATPSGRRPTPTSMWKDIRRQWREAAFSDLRSPGSPATSSAPTASRSGAIDFPGAVDFPLIAREVAAAAQCQQHHQHLHQSRQQSIGWSASTLLSLGSGGVTQVDWNQYQRPRNRGFGLLLSSLGYPTKS